MEVNLFIPAAGLGTRLYPLTKDKPKALVEINGKPMIQHVLDKFTTSNSLHISKIIVNVHHFADKLVNFLYNYDSKIIISDETDRLLDTGGGLKQALSILSDNTPLLVHNVDIESNFNFDEFCNQNFDNSTLATLVVSDRESSRHLLFNKEMQLIGWENIKTNEKILIEHIPSVSSVSSVSSESLCQTSVPLCQTSVSLCQTTASLCSSFSGIQLVNPKIQENFTKERAFPLIPEYLRLAQNHIFKGYVANDSYFNDLGKL